MKKLKNSVKAIIISAVAVVIAASTVLAVILTRKDDNGGGGNPPVTPPTPGVNYELTAAQLGLVNAINAKVDAEQAAEYKELEVYEASRFPLIDGTFLSANEISYECEDYVVKRVELPNGFSSIEYFYYNSERMLVSMNDKIFPDFNGHMISALEFSSDVVGYVVKPREDSFEGVKLELYSIKDKENPVKLFEKTSTYGDQLDDVAIVSYENCFMFKFMYTDSNLVEYVDITFISYPDETNQVDELLHFTITLETYKTGRLVLNQYAFYYKDTDNVKMFSRAGLIEFEPNAACYYEYEILEFGILIKEFDSQYQNPKYLFLSFEDGEFYNLTLDEGYLIDCVEAVDDKYFYVLAKTDLTAEEGRFFYFDCHGNLILKYNSITDDDNIRYSDGKFVLLYNKIIATEKAVGFVDYLVLNTEEVYNIFDSSIAVNKDYFAMYGTNKNIYNFEGVALFENDFESLFENNGHYVGVYQEQYYYLNVDTKTPILIEGIDNELTFEFNFNEKTLFDLGLIVLEGSNNIYSIVDYAGNVKTFNDGNNVVRLENIIDISQSLSTDNFYVLQIEFSNNDTIALTFYDKFEVEEEEPEYGSSRSNEASAYYTWASQKSDSKYYGKVKYSFTDYGGKDCTFSITVTISYSNHKITSSDSGSYSGIDTKHVVTDSGDEDVGGFWWKVGFKTKIDSWNNSGKWASGNSASYQGDASNMYYYVRYWSVAPSSGSSIDYENVTSSNYSSSDSYSVVKTYYDKYESGENHADDYADGKVTVHDYINGASKSGYWSNTYWTAPSNKLNLSRITDPSSSLYSGKYYTYGDGDFNGTVSNGTLQQYWYVFAIYQPDLYNIKYDRLGVDMEGNGMDGYGYTATDLGVDRYSTTTFVPYWVLSGTGSTNSNKQYTYQDGKVSATKEQTILAAPSLSGYVFHGWKIDFGTTTRDQYIKDNYTGDDGVIEYVGGYFKKGSTTITSMSKLNYGKSYLSNGNDSSKYESVTFTAVWKPADFDITFEYGDVSGSSINAKTKVEISLLPHPTTSDAYYASYTIGTHTYYSLSDTPAADKITFAKFTFNGNSSALGVTIDGNNYPIFDGNGNLVTGNKDNNECPSALTVGVTYYFLYSQNIKQNADLFDIDIKGTKLKGNNGATVDGKSSLVVGSDYNIAYGTKFAPTETIKNIFDGVGTMTGELSSIIFDVNRTSVIGSSFMFAGWTISTTTGSQTHLLQPIENDSRELLDYIRDLNASGLYDGVTVYAVFSMKPYRLDTTPQEVENSATSMSTANGYASKVEKNPSDTTKINPNLENVDLINTGLVQSIVQVKASNANPAYLGNITLELTISNSESSGSGKTQDQTDNPYYVFEKVEIYRLGVKIYGGCGTSGCTKAGDGYCYHAAMVVLTCNGASWAVNSYADFNNDSHLSDGDGYETPLSTSYYGGSIDNTTSPYYIGKYNTGNDSDNKYNRITVSNKTETTITISVAYLGISGDYFDTGNNMKHQTGSGYTFKINSASAEGGFYGFTVKPYVKANAVQDDGITISTDSNSTEDSVITTSIQKMYKDGSNFVIWLDNVKYSISSTQVKTGTQTNGGAYFALSGNTLSLSSYTSFLDDSGNVRNNLVYIRRISDSEYYVYAPQRYVTKSGGLKTFATPGTYPATNVTGYNGTNVNYGSTLLYAIRPEQKLLYASKTPTTSSVTKQSYYELTSYISKIDFGSSRVFNFELERKISVSGTNYVYSDLSIVNKTTGTSKGSLFTEAHQKEIVYLGNDYYIHHAWYYTPGGNSGDNVYKNRTFILYLTTNKDNGEFMYFIFTDVYSAGKIEDNTSTDLSITLTFNKIEKTVKLNLNKDVPDGVSNYTVDNNDLFDATDIPIVYRYYYTRGATKATSYTSTGLTGKEGSSTPVAFGSYSAGQTGGYLTTANHVWKFNPDDFLIYELQPTSGYLINRLVIKIKGRVIADLTMNNLTRLESGSNYFSYTVDGGGGNVRTQIGYGATTDSKYFKRYVNGTDTKMISGIGYSRAVVAEWESGYSSANFNPIWIMISGVYDDVEIYATTISYLEFNITDDENNNLGFSGSTTNIQLTQFANLSLITEYDGKSIKLGTTVSGTTYKASEIHANDRNYRIIFLGKGLWFRNGLHVYASGETYSAYFTAAKLYLDVEISGSGSSKTVSSKPTAFERFNGLAGSLFYGRDSAGNSLYSNDAGLNLAIYNSSGQSLDHEDIALSYTNKEVNSNDYLNYFYIQNIQQYFLDTGAYNRVHGASSEFEYSNKFLLGLTIKRNTVSATMNSYLFNSTLTSTETKPTSSEYTYEFLGHSASFEHYYDTTKYLNWLKTSEGWAAYQLDYIGSLANDATYTKKSSWFNDTILTNIDMKYYDTVDSNINTQNNQVGPTAYSNMTRSIYGYGLGFDYYEIPGYYLQYIEIITVDYGSIYVPVQTLLKQIAGSVSTEMYKSNNASANAYNGNGVYHGEYPIYKLSSSLDSSGLYIEVKYISTEGEDPRFEIKFYQDSADILAAHKSLNLLANNITVNFYSAPQTYEMNVYAFAKENDGITSSKETVSTYQTLGVYKNGSKLDVEVTPDTDPSISQVVTYDSLSIIDAYFTMDGYTFVGFGSKNYYDGAGAFVSRYDGDANIWNSSSRWHDIRSIFDSSQRERFINYWGDTSTPITNSFSSVGDNDFYVKSTTSNHSKTAYFITDTGYGATGKNQENYNFWSAYDFLFMQNLGNYGQESFPTISLYAIWKANTYTLQFDVNDDSVNNGSTSSKLQIANGNARKFDFKDEFNTQEYLYYNIYDTTKATPEVDRTKTYYCFVTFDSSDWFVKKASYKTALAYYDLFTSYKATGYYESFITKYSDGYNDLKAVIDRYGYTWLGWFSFASTDTDKNINTKQDMDASQYSVRRDDLVFGSNYYKKMTTGDAGSNYYNYFGSGAVDGGMPVLNKDLYNRFKANGTINEITSEFVYWGEHKVISALGNSYVSYYRYDTSKTTDASLYNLSMMNNTDWLNSFAGTQKLTNNAGGIEVASSITYFDTTMSYSNYVYDKSTNELEFLRSADTDKNRLLKLTAYWEENNYKVVVDWQDNNSNEDGDEFFTRHQYGSSEAGILQANGSVLKESFGTAYFDDFELSERLNKFIPVRIGYDFVGWTFYYNEASGAINLPSTFDMSISASGDNQGYSTVYHNYLRQNILTSRIVLYTNDGLLQSGNFTPNVEKLGDTEVFNDSMRHTVYVFALWKPQTFTINLDLNIEYEDLENLYEIDSNFAVALYDQAHGDGTFDIKGIRSDYYRLNSGYYTEIVANVNFTITFDQKFSTAWCILDGKTFYIKDLFATSAGYYFLGWLYDAGSTASLLLANSLQSMITAYSNIAESHNDAGTIGYGFGDPIFDVNYHEEYLRVTNYNPRLLYPDNGTFEGEEKFKKDPIAGTPVVYNNLTPLSEINNHGLSSNFGYVKIGSTFCEIVSEVVEQDYEKKYYLYFRYLGVKYYVVMYYQPNENGTRTAFTCDDSYLYFKYGDVNYKVRYDTNNNTPYIVTSDYDNRFEFKGNDRIKIAVFGELSHTTNITRNDMVTRTTDNKYTFRNYIDNVAVQDGEYKLTKKTTTTGGLQFFAGTTRQFTLYAHWQHKNDMSIVINNGNNSSGTSSSNEGLSGFYEVENSYSENHNVGKDVDSLTNATNVKTETDDGCDEGYDDANLDLTFNYYDNLDFNIVPFYNGRYISELTMKFYAVTEIVKSYSDDSALMKSDFVYTTYTLVFKFKWNADTHTISVDNITFNNGISAENINCAKTVSDMGVYSRVYNLTSSGVKIKQLSILDSTSFNTHILKMFEYSNGTTTGGVANNDLNATYGRKDVNKVAFNLTKVMSNIDITCKFSVQTYSLEMYHFLDNKENRKIEHLDGVGDNNQYETDITPIDFEDIKSKSNFEGQDPFIAGQVSNKTNVVTISIDCSENIATYLVPYGYYIYGVYYDSSYVGYRPVDDTNEYYNANAIVTNPFYGFEWLYADGYYNYGSTTVPVEQFDGDLLNAQCSPILGSKNKFSQAVRLDNLANYNFVGWYETEVSHTGYITLLHYDKLYESRYINRNITLYGYYKPVNAPTSIEFYTWDDANKSYKVYTGNKQEYTLNSNVENKPFEADDATQFISLREDQNDFLDENNYAKLIVNNNFGIDETSFNSKDNSNNIFDGDDFGQNDLQDQAMLDKILQTYWFYYYSYEVLDFVYNSKTHTVRYDAARDERGEAPFYYYTNESAQTGIVYGNIKTNDYEHFVFVTEAGEQIGTQDSYTLREVVVYDFDGSYLYLKLPKTNNNSVSEGQMERYYRVYEIKNIADYINSINGTPYDADDHPWVVEHEPRYYVDVLGERYYILPRIGGGSDATDIAKNNKAQVLYDINGNYTFTGAASNHITNEIVAYASFENINNYFIDYYEVYYQVRYKTYTDQGGSVFINPKHDNTTNQVTLPEVLGNPTDFYFDYNSATMYYNGAPSTINHYVYCPVNTNYRSNVEFRTYLGNSSWETAGVTIKTLPSPHIGYWYDGGEEYGFVGYISVNDAILETITKRGDSASGGEASSGDMYRAFLEYINAVYKITDYDDASDFARPELFDAYLNRYAPGSGYGAARIETAFTTFIAALKEEIGLRVGSYKLSDLCSNLLLADSYDYESYAQKVISFVNVNVPVSFKNMNIADPRTGASSTSISVSFLYKFSIITQDTEVRDNLYAIPIYSPFIMEFSNDDVVAAGSALTINVKEMDIWHFDIQNNATAHVYNVDSGDMVNFAVLSYEQYLTLKSNSVNVADYLTKMLKQGTVLATAEEILSEDGEGIRQRTAMLDFNSYPTGHYVVLAYYYKTGTVIDNMGVKDYSTAYVARVSDNLLHVTKGADGNVTFEVTTMDEYE